MKEYMDINTVNSDWSASAKPRIVLPVILTDDELQSGHWSFANTMLEEFQDRVAWFNNTTVFAFPMPVREGSVLSFDVAMAENLNDMNDLGQLVSDVYLKQHTMVKDVFYISELFVQFNDDTRCMTKAPARPSLSEKPTPLDMMKNIFKLRWWGRFLRNVHTLKGFGDP